MKYECIREANTIIYVVGWVSTAAERVDWAPLKAYKYYVDARTGLIILFFLESTRRRCCCTYYYNIIIVWSGVYATYIMPRITIHYTRARSRVGN